MVATKPLVLLLSVLAFTAEAASFEHLKGPHHVQVARRAEANLTRRTPPKANHYEKGKLDTTHGTEPHHQEPVVEHPDEDPLHNNGPLTGSGGPDAGLNDAKVDTTTTPPIKSGVE
jgi:hypothetical protein